jgi:adenylate kinase family enzyme
MMQRFMIIGQPGSGKSTLARAIGDRTGLPVVHVDLIHWKSGWVERDKDEKVRLALEAEAHPKWVFEGGLSKTWENRLARADTLIWIDLPLRLRAWRVLKRTIRYYGRTRPDLPDGCPEQISLEFWKWIWDTRRTGRGYATRIFADPPAHVTLHHLQSRAAVAAYLKTLDAAPSMGHPTSP